MKQVIEWVPRSNVKIYGYNLANVQSPERPPLCATFGGCLDFSKDWGGSRLFPRVPCPTFTELSFHSNSSMFVENKFEPSCHGFSFQTCRSKTEMVPNVVSNP
jgi:hypothetical protein